MKLLVLFLLACAALAAHNGGAAQREDPDPDDGAEWRTSLAPAPTPPFPLDFNDVARCTNAFNNVFFGIDQAKASNCGNAPAQIAELTALLTPNVQPGIIYTAIDQPVPPAFTTLITYTAVGPAAMAAAIVNNMPDCGENHVAGPISFQSLTRNANGTRVYGMVTNDVDYTFQPATGCVVFLARKEVSCTVSPVFINGVLRRQARIGPLLVVTFNSAYRIPSSQGCVLWVPGGDGQFPTA
jgi:hypothetical protein